MAQVRTRKRGKTFSYNDFLHGNIGITSEEITLADFMSAWLANVVALNVKPTSLQNYRSLFKTHIAPHLGTARVQDLTPALLDKWIRALQRTGLSFNTLSLLHTLIHNALNYAVYPAQLISSNPAAYIKVPKNAPCNVIKRHIITPDRFGDLLLKYPFGTPYYIPLLLLYYTGMRLGEVLGLSWQDIDFAAKKITLRRQIRYLSKRRYFFTMLKTESNRRYILVDDFLLGESKRWQVRQLENEKQCGDRYVYTYREENGHVERRSKGLPSPEGEKIPLICTHNYGRIILRGVLMRLLFIEGLNTLSFRHTHATVLTEYGANPKGVSG